MRLLPVIDLKDKLVVRGVAGRRESYRPVESVLARDPRPATVAAALVDRFRFTDVYVADLGALAGGEPDWESLQAIATAGLDLILDAGVRDARDLERLTSTAEIVSHLSGVVIAGESIRDRASLREAVQQVGSERAYFSLDLLAGQLLGMSPAWKGFTPEALAHEAVEAGFTRMIVLDLAAVGVGTGPTTTRLCSTLKVRFPHLHLVSGGGIRGDDDLQTLAEAGCDRVLVASALHAGVPLTRGLPVQGP